MRLDKYICECTALTRSEVKKFIKAGRVTVDGIVIAKSDEHINENDSIITLDNALVQYKKFVYIMLNKPSGYISAVYDKHYPVVTDLVDCSVHKDLSPVGRLDLDTEGLLLLTDDGAFNHNMTSPKKNVYKRYFARLDKPATEDDIKAFDDGMIFKDFRAKSARLELTENPCEVFIEIAEGKFHQVKRMCERVGKTVTYLKRVSIGSLELDKTLKLGDSRELTEAELEKLSSLFNDSTEKI